MNPQLQGSSINLQGGGGISLQGSSPQLQSGTPNLQGNGIPLAQPQLGTISLGLNKVQAAANSGQSAANQTQSQWGALQQQIQSLLTSLANKPVAQHIDLNAVRSQAAAQATANVNPLYTQKLNEYLQNEAAANAEAQKQQQLTVQAAQQGLANTQAQNTQQQQYTGQKTAMEQGQINTQEGNYQQNQGTSFDMKRAALAQNIGSSGLAASGIGQQQLWQAENLRNVEEAQQTGQFQYNRNLLNLEQSNTFAQLAQSNIYAGQVEQGKEAQANFDLNSYLRQAAYNEQTFRESNEAQRQADILIQTNQAAQQQVANIINAIKNPGVQAATQQAYAGSFA